jgi:putative ABC transport system permease protein
MILWESLALGLAGGVLGCGLGVVLMRLAQVIPVVRGKVEGWVNPISFAVALAVALCLGVLGGLYPALRASRLPPTEALRHT